MKVGFERDKRPNLNQILDLEFSGTNAAFWLGLRLLMKGAKWMGSGVFYAVFYQVKMLQP